LGRGKGAAAHAGPHTWARTPRVLLGTRAAHLGRRACAHRHGMTMEGFHRLGDAVGAASSCAAAFCASPCNIRLGLDVCLLSRRLLLARPRLLGISYLPGAHAACAPRVAARPRCASSCMHMQVCPVRRPSRPATPAGPAAEAAASADFPHRAGCWPHPPAASASQWPGRRRWRQQGGSGRWPQRQRRTTLGRRRRQPASGPIAAAEGLAEAAGLGSNPAWRWRWRGRSGPAR
jgi:hypothetical protein